MDVPAAAGGERRAKVAPFEAAALGRAGCDACVARVAMDGHPGLARSRECAAQCPDPAPIN
jgi:hypothetical protein